MRSLALLAGLALLCAAAPALAAKPRTSPIGPYEAFTPPAPAAATLHTPIGMLVHSAVGDIPSTGAFTDLDAPTVVRCPSDNGCTIVITAMAQVRTNAADGYWALCPGVDGNITPAACPFQGRLTDQGGVVVGNVQADYQVAKGNHAVYTKAFFATGGIVSNYHVVYELTTP